MWKGPTYDCQLCGACCVNYRRFDGAGYVYLTKDESKRMKRLGLSVVQATGGEAHLGMRNRDASGKGVCVAFQGGIGGSCGCTVYAGRPSICRAFQVGGAECERARREAGLTVELKG
jgi:uncharacterized protein